MSIDDRYRYRYTPETCPGNDPAHLTLRRICGWCGFDRAPAPNTVELVEPVEPVKSGLTPLRQLMDDNQVYSHAPRHRREMFWDRWRRGRK